MIGVTRRDADCLIRDVSTTNGTDFTDLYGAHLTSVVAASLCLGAAAVLPSTTRRHNAAATPRKLYPIAPNNFE